MQPCQVTGLAFIHSTTQSSTILTQAGPAPSHDLVAPPPRVAQRPHQNSRGRRTPLFHPPAVIMPSTTSSKPHHRVRALEARGQEPPRGQEALPPAEEWGRVAGARGQESQHGASQHGADVEASCKHYHRPELCCTHPSTGLGRLKNETRT